jgi:predicted nucleotidyltransferase
MSSIVTTNTVSIPSIRKIAATVFSQYPVKRAFLFGSQARETATVNSDVDILVTLEQPLGLIAFNRMVGELSDQLGVSVDVATTKSFDKDMAGFVLDDLTPIYERA